MSAFQLRWWERRQLLNLLGHPHDAKQLRRAQALVWLQEGQPVRRVAELLRVGPRTVYNWVYAFRQRTDLAHLARLRDAPRSGRPPTALGIEIRLLPRATPELNAMDALWKQVKRDALGDWPTASIDQSAAGACEHILAMRPHDRLRQAGVLSGNFWLTN